MAAWKPAPETDSPECREIRKPEILTTATRHLR
jgi:hypothetical protein